MEKDPIDRTSTVPILNEAKTKDQEPAKKSAINSNQNIEKR